jgi:hypothetical protein
MGRFQEGDCAIVVNARRLAVKRGLDPSKIACSACVEGTGCVYSGDQSPTLVKDVIQNLRLQRVEGRANLDNFYNKLRKYFDLSRDSK